MMASRTPLDPNDFVIQDLDDHDIDSLLSDLNSAIITKVYNAPTVPPPPGVAEYLAKRVVYGGYQYHDDLNTPSATDSDDIPSFAQLPDATPLPPIHEDMSPSERIQRAIVAAITSFYQFENKIDFVKGTPRTLIAGHSEQIERPTVASAYVVDFVRVAYEIIDEDRKLESITKLLTGFGTCPSRYYSWEGDYLNNIGRHGAASEVDLVYREILFSLVSNAETYMRKRVYSEPGVRWKLSLRAKLGLALVQGSNGNHFKLACRALDIDFAHHFIELGLALSHPILGNAIVAPYSATELILYEMAGCVKTRKDRSFQDYEREGTFQALWKEDEGITVEVVEGLSVPQESIVSLDFYFAKGELARFVEQCPDMLFKTIVSKHGIALYGITLVGPWFMIGCGRAKDGRNPLKRVLHVGPGEREPQAARQALQEKSQRLREDWLSECPVGEETKRRFRNIINKPGRALVRRSGIRGVFGRIVVFGLVACGFTTIGVNWAGRENWLERLFDGAQVASLLAGLTVVVIFMATRTLTNTLDLLGGVTEAQDLRQLLSLTGMSVEELQEVLLYARGTLYWLSEHRASYCRAVRLGEIVMTSAFELKRNPEGSTCLVLSEANAEGVREAVWVLQGRCMALENAEVGEARRNGGLWQVVEELQNEQRTVTGTVYEEEIV